MGCCQCQGIETLFDEKFVTKELANYRKKGSDRTTRILLDQLRAEGINGMTLLDIGGGVGVISNELFKDGISRATNVEASAAYLRAAKDEAVRQGHADRVTYHHGNYVDLAADIPPADIVTLDRVICCYDDMPTLVDKSTAKARRLYGLVYPRDTWWCKLGVVVTNLVCRLQKSSYRAFVYSTAAVDAAVRSSGLQRRYYRQTFIWQIVVYSR